MDIFEKVANATKKLKNKSLDLIVMNSLKEPGAGFGVSTNRVTIISSSGKLIEGQLKPKREVAIDIVDEILVSLNTKQTS